ncbi:MAG: hypothetical protein WBE80_10420 [Methylocella sp.]
MTETMRRKIAAATTAKIALEALRERATAADLAPCREVRPPAAIHHASLDGTFSYLRPNQTCAGKKRLFENAARAFDAGVGRGAETAREREVEKRHAKIGRLAADGSTSSP